MMTLPNMRALAGRTVAALCCAAALTACEKNAVQDITGALPGARIRFFNFGLNAPSVNFYANDAKVSATGSATGVEATTGVSFGGVSLGGFYSGIAPGQYTFTGRIAATVDKDLPVATVQQTLEDGKRYSLYMSGPYDATAKQSDAFIVEDAFTDSIDFSQAYVRFVNASHNSQPMRLVIQSTVAGSPEIVVGTEVAYKSAGAFQAVPIGTYNVFARVAGATTNAISRTGTTAVSMAGGRIYTISARGDMTITSTTAANRPFLDNTPNR